MPAERPALVIGFEPYGGRADNPSAAVARALDGATIAGVSVVG
ncbi:MAG: pyroglutamyl-peptidase I, partial [Alphaproteobacteria bacterium]